MTSRLNGWMVGSEQPNEPAEERIASSLESLLLVAGGPVSISALATVLDESKRRVRDVLTVLQHERSGGVRVQVDGDSAQMVTAPENDEIVRRFIGTEKPAPLSRAALETLTIIAYRQPVTRAEIEAARGANSDRHVHILLARGLIDDCGQREVIGRPMQYGTTFAFLEYFGLGSLDDLPPLADADAGELRQEEIGLRAGQAALARAPEDE